MAKGHGMNFKILREFTLKHYGQAGFDKLFAAVDPEEQEKLRTNFVAWTELRETTKMMRTMAKVFNCPEDDLAVAVGRYCTQVNYGVVMRFVIALASPVKVLSRCPATWEKECGSGKLAEFKLEDKKCTFDLVDFEDPGLHCLVLVGDLLEAIEMTGAKNVKVIHTECIGKGGKRCHFEATWE